MVAILVGLFAVVQVVAYRMLTTLVLAQVAVILCKLVTVDAGVKQPAVIHVSQE